jgi:hypothetical protein
VFVELCTDHPLLDLELFHNRVFDSMIVAGTIGNAVYNVVIFGATIHLQQVRSLSPIQAGAVFLALSLGASVATSCDQIRRDALDDRQGMVHPGPSHDLRYPRV